MHSRSTGSVAARSGIFAKTAAVVLMGMVPATVLANKPKPPPPPPPPPPAPAPTKANNQLFSWFETGSPPPVNPQYIGAPFLRDSNAAAVNAYFKTLPSGAIKAVKVENPGISNATAALIFNNSSYNVSYVFGDLEGGNAAFKAAELVKQVRYVTGGSTWATTSHHDDDDDRDRFNRSLTRSSKAFIGNFGFATIVCDPTRPDDYNFHGQHSFSGYNICQYGFAGLTMSNEEAYPGSPSFRNKAAGDKPSGGGVYPNIRSSLFVLPAWRVGEVTATSEAYHVNTENIPYTANFNNWGNLGLDNDRNAANGYKFVTGQAMLAKTVNGKHYPAISAAQTTDQLLSRKDFATMVTHMRLRGADSIHLLESGLSGSTLQQMQDDAATGWNGEFSMNAIFNKSDHRLLIGNEQDGSYFDHGKYGDNSTIIIDGHKKDIDQAGAMFSGAYSLSLGKLDVLLSNMDDSGHKLTLPSKIGGYALATKDFTLGAGTHWMVDYTLSGSGNNKKWNVAGQHVPYTAIANSRGGFGIPEPGTLSLLAVGAVLGLNRRTRRQVEPVTA